MPHNPTARPITVVQELDRPVEPRPAVVAAPPPPMVPSRAAIPSYRLHRASGQAVVTIAGRDRYLGRYASAESRAAYDREIAEWLARGRPRFGPAECRRFDQRPRPPRKC